MRTVCRLSDPQNEAFQIASLGYGDQGPNEINHAFHYALFYFDIASADAQTIIQGARVSIEILTADRI